jgi:hypothetical protein
MLRSEDALYLVPAEYSSNNDTAVGNENVLVNLLINELFKLFNIYFHSFFLLMFTTREKTMITKTMKMIQMFMQAGSMLIIIMMLMRMRMRMLIMTMMVMMMMMLRMMMIIVKLKKVIRSRKWKFQWSYM